MIPKQDTSNYTPIGISTFADWEALPRSQRERRVSFWITPWYKRPYSLKWDPAILNVSLTKSLSEWEQVDNYLKREYPIQFWVRETLENIEMWYQYDVKSAVLRFWENWIVGQRAEMRKQVFQRKYRDLDQIIIDFHIQCIIEIVDREKTFEYTDYEYSEQDVQFAAELRRMYDYATRERALLSKSIDEEFSRANDTWNGDIKVYDVANSLESKLNEKDTELCNWVVKNRDRLWT